MFDSGNTADPAARGRLLASTTLSLLIYSAIAAALFIASRSVAPALVEATVDVLFKAAPAPVVAAPSRPQPAAAKPKSGPATPRVTAVVPVLRPTSEAPREAEPTTEAVAPTADTAQVAGGGDGSTGAGTGGSGGGREPINLPENATPPKALDSNAAPGFPEQARAAGLEGIVVLKIVVDSDGSVSSVTAMKGEEPFLSAAIAAVKAWRYSPALVAGVATPVFRIVKIPFRLRG